MAQPVRGFQINTALDRLALDVLRILGACLAVAPFDRDRLQLAILVTLSRKVFVDNLLYRDFRLQRDGQWYSWTLPDGEVVRIHEQAVVYLHQVLARRTRLAKRLRHEPGNMHLLLGLLCRYGPSGRGWEHAEVRRDQALAPACDEPDFEDSLGRALQLQRMRLGGDYSEVSVRRREEHGPLWLIRGNCAAEVPEEMSLFDVTDAAPVPLQDAFTEAPDVQRMLARVMDSLNERYMLLRACGLDPETWHDRDEPSIARLREMKQLRAPAEDLLRRGKEDDAFVAYRRAFDDLKGQAKMFAGAASFDAFAASEAGMAMLRISTPSLDEVLGADDEDDRSRGDTFADDEAIDPAEAAGARAEASDWVLHLIDHRPELFDPVMTHFFKEVVGSGRPIQGEDGVLADEALKALAAEDPELAGLRPNALARELYARAEAIIRQGLDASGYPES